MTGDRVREEGRPVAGPEPSAPSGREGSSPLLEWGARRLVVVLVGGVLGLAATALGLRGGSDGATALRGPVLTPSLPWSTGGAPTGAPRTVAPVDGRTVLTVQARYGWLPDAVRTLEYRSTPDGALVRAQTAPGDGSAMFDLAVFPAGVTPGPSSRPGVRRDAPQVNGQDAYWVSVDGSGQRLSVDTLRFRGADGGWLELTATGLTGADRQELPLKMAAAVVPGPYRVPLPVSMASLPPRTELAEAKLLRPVADRPGFEQWSASLSFRNKDDGFVTIDAGPGEYASGSGGGMSNSGSGPLAVSSTQKCTTGKGLHWCARLIQVGGGAPADPANWLALVAPRGTDESGWTTEVLP